jgi:pyruvate formate lyase activating enzyme
VALDIKAPKGKYQSVFEYRDKRLVKDVVDRIEDTLKILKETGVDFECRTTVVPTLLTEKDILKIAHWISPYCKKYYLQNFINKKITLNPDFQKLKPYPEKFLLKLQKEIAPLFKICQIR